MKKISVLGTQFVNEDGPVFLIGLNAPDHELSADLPIGSGGEVLIDLLASYKINALSLTLNNWGSNSENSVFPWTNYEMGNLSLVADPSVVITYDDAKFGRWRTFVQYANEKGIHVFLKLWNSKNARNWGFLNPHVNVFIEKIKQYFADLSVTITADFQSFRADEQQLVDFIKGEGLDFVFKESVVVADGPLQVDALKKVLWSKPFKDYNAILIDLTDDGYTKYAPIFEEIEIFFYVIKDSGFYLFSTILDGTTPISFFYEDSNGNVVSSDQFEKEGKQVRVFGKIYYSAEFDVNPVSNTEIVFDPGQSFTVSQKADGKLLLKLNP